MRRTRVAPDGPAPSLTQRGRAMQQDSAVFVGLDTSKMKISVALAEDGRQGEVRFLGDLDHMPEAVRRLVTKLAGKNGGVLFCYEAGPTGYGLQRQICALGHDCAVIAPSLIPKRPATPTRGATWWPAWPCASPRPVREHARPSGELPTAVDKHRARPHRMAQ